jgi:hypothetical protein
MAGTFTFDINPKGYGFSNPIDDVKSGYDFGQGVAKDETLAEVGRRLASGDRKGAENAAYQGGQLDTGMKVNEFGAELDKREVDKAMRITKALGNLALMADGKPESGHWDAAMKMFEARGMKIPDAYRDPVNGPRLALAEANSAKELLERAKTKVEIGMTGAHAGLYSAQTDLVRGQLSQLGQKASGEFELGPDHVRFGRRINPDTGQAEVYEIARGGAKEQKLPAGYRRSAVEPGKLEPIPGGPADKITGEQAAKTAMLVEAQRSLPAVRQIFLGTPATADKPAVQPALGSSLSPVAYAKSQFAIGDVGEGQRLMETGMEAILRALTGAAAPKEEVAKNLHQYLPVPSDSVETRKRKLDLYERVVTRITQLSAHGASGSDILRELNAGSGTTPALSLGAPPAAGGTAPMMRSTPGGAATPPPVFNQLPEAQQLTAIQRLMDNSGLAPDFVEKFGPEAFTQAQRVIEEFKRGDAERRQQAVPAMPDPLSNFDAAGQFRGGR